MELRGYWIRITDNLNYRAFGILAQDAVFARMKAAWFLDDTNWRIEAVIELA